MFARVTTVAFEGIEARPIDVQVQIGPGMPHFTIVGLPDKAVAESRERVRGALNAIGLALPPKRITVASPQPTSRRKAATTTSPSRSGCWPRLGPWPMTRSKPIACSASCP